MSSNTRVADGFKTPVANYQLNTGTTSAAVTIPWEHRCISIFARDMGYEDAIEHFDFNVIGAWLGEGTPIFIEVFGSDCDSFPQGIGIDISGK